MGESGVVSGRKSENARFWNEYRIVNGEVQWRAGEDCGPWFPVGRQDEYATAESRHLIERGILRG